MEGSYGPNEWATQGACFGLLRCQSVSLVTVHILLGLCHLTLALALVQALGVAW